MWQTLNDYWIILFLEWDAKILEQQQGVNVRIHGENLI